MNQRRAFTLLELLVVIGILGLLLGILLPSLHSARVSAKANVCLSHLKGLGNALVLYLNENNDVFPPFRLTGLTADFDHSKPYVNGHGRFSPRWQWFLETDQGPVIATAPFAGEIQRSGGFYDGSVPRPANGGGGRTMAVELFTCPALAEPEFEADIRDGAYGYNYQYLGNARNDTLPSRWDNFGVGLHSLRSPSETVGIADSRGAGRRHGKHAYTLDPPRLAKERGAQRFGPVRTPSDWIAGPTDIDELVEDGLDPEVYAYSPAEPRHKNLANVVFADGHAEAKSLTELGYEKIDKEAHPRALDTTPMPIHDPFGETYNASNRLWNGDGSDPIAEDRRPK